MPVVIGSHILSFEPDAARAFQAASRTLQSMSTLFLGLHVREIATLCSSRASTLYHLIHDRLTHFQPHFESQPHSAPIRFLLSVPMCLESLEISKCRLNAILSAWEIGQFNERIENVNLQRIWGRVRNQIIAAHPLQGPLQGGTPAVNASAQAIRDWLNAEANQTLLQRIVDLNLNGHHLFCIPKETNLHTGLQRLYLASNRLVSLPEESFQNLGALEELNLADNRLTSLPVGIFQGLTALRRLGLNKNQLVFLPEGLLQGLSNLQELALTHNQLTFLPEGLFQELKSLQWLNLCGNHLFSIPEGLFQGLTALQTIGLNHNQLVSLPEGLFQGLSAVQDILISHNHLISIPQGLFQGLSVLHGLFLCRNRLTSLPVGLFHGLTSLQTLELSFNQFASLHEALFQGLTGLHTLCLSHNQLVSLRRGLFQEPIALQRLSLRCNQLASLHEGLFQRLPALRELLLSGNQFVSLPQGLLQGLEALQRLSLGNNSRLLLFLGNIPAETNIIAIRETIRVFFNYECQSSFASFYQLAAKGAPLEAVRELFSELPSDIKNAIFGKVWKEAGCPNTDDPQWGEHHAFDHQGVFYGALRRYVRETFDALSEDQRNEVYRHVYDLARREPGAESINFDFPQWGELHARDHILRLIDALMRLQL